MNKQQLVVNIKETNTLLAHSGSPFNYALDVKSTAVFRLLEGVIVGTLTIKNPTYARLNALVKNDYAKYLGEAIEQDNYTLTEDDLATLNFTDPLTTDDYLLSIHNGY